MQQNQIYYPPTEEHIQKSPHCHNLEPEPLLLQIKKFIKRKYNPGPITGILPVLKLLKTRYTLTDAGVDLLSGATLSTVLIPQSLSYAVLCGLSPQYGLYSAFIAPLIYFLFGTTRELSVGPFALVSIIIGEMITNMYPELITIAKTDPDLALRLRVIYTMTLTFISGIYLILMSCFKLGWIIDLVSSPGVDGLIMATALSVSASQLGALFGVDTGQGSFLHCLIGLFSNIKKTNFISLIIGTIGIIVLILSDLYCTRKKLKIPLPSQIVLVILATAISTIFSLNKNFKVAVVGTIPMGFISSTIPSFSGLFSTTAYFINGFLVAVVCFVISSSVSQKYAEMHKYKVNFNSELFSLGLASLIGSFTNSFVSSASLSRTSVVNACKPRTNLWNLWSSLIILLVILFLGPLLYHLPKAVLSSIVIGAFRGQFLKYKEGFTTFSKSPIEGCVYFITLLVTLFISIQAGLVAAFASSLFAIILRLSTFTPTFLLPIPSTQRFEHYHRFTLTPYYQFVDEIESRGGLNKRHKPTGTKNRSNRSLDNELYGTTPQNDNGYIQHIDDDISTETDSNDANNNFSVYNLNNTPSSTTTTPQSLSTSGSINNYPYGYGTNNINETPLATTNQKQLEMLFTIQNPNAVVLHIGSSITFLNSNPVSEYIQRYIEVYQEFHKKTQLISSSIQQSRSITNQQQHTHNNDNSDDDNETTKTIITSQSHLPYVEPSDIQSLPHNQLPQQQGNQPLSPFSQLIQQFTPTETFTDDDYLLLAPETLRQTLRNPAQSTSLPSTPIIPFSIATNINLSPPSPICEDPYMDNIFGSDTTLNSAQTSSQQHLPQFDREFDPSSGINNDDVTTGELITQHSLPSTTKHQSKSILPHLSLHTNSSLGNSQDNNNTKSQLQFPPHSPSTLTTISLLSPLQMKLFTTLIYDTIHKLSDEQISKYEFCIIFDSISFIDLTGETMLTKLRTQYPFVLFLFTRPTQQLIPILSRHKFPFNLILNDIYIAVEYAKYVIDMATATRLYIKKQEQIQSIDDTNTNTNNNNANNV